MTDSFHRLENSFSLSLNLYILFWSRCFARWLIIIKLYLMIMPSCFFVLFFFCGVECLSSLFTLCFFFFLNIGNTFLFWTGNHGDETYFLKTLSFQNNNNKQLYITININVDAVNLYRVIVMLRPLMFKNTIDMSGWWWVDPSFFILFFFFPPSRFCLSDAGQNAFTGKMPWPVLKSKQKENVKTS